MHPPHTKRPAQASFDVGDLVHHRRFDYRGVIVDVDASFQGSDAWYEQVARSRPPKDAPWYHVLPHDATHTTYVAERHLEPDREEQEHHAELRVHFHRLPGDEPEARRPDEHARQEEAHDGGQPHPVAREQDHDGRHQDDDEVRDHGLQPDGPVH